MTILKATKFRMLLIQLLKVSKDHYKIKINIQTISRYIVSLETNIVEILIGTIFEDI